MNIFKRTDEPDETSQGERQLPPGLFNDDTAPTILVPGRGSGLGEMGARHPMGDRVDTEHYMRVPVQRRAPVELPCWRVEFAFDDAMLPVLRLVVIDSAVMGRGKTADVNLEPYDEANTLGISRKHAMLRPAQRALYFFDTDSTNGSYHNGVKVGSNAASLALGDVIRLGRLSMTIRRIERIA
jgi:hypothetical protein